SSRVVTLFVLCLVGGCQSAEKASLTPLAPDVVPTFAELIQRGKSQINAAHEFYYSDRWKDLELATVALKETGTYISQLKLDAANEGQKARLTLLTREFNETADALKVAANSQDATKTNQLFMKLNEVYKQLRIEQMTLAPAGGGSEPPAVPPANVPPSNVPPAPGK
ncbi:MAG TPA: hypothetical protein PKD72_13105, partial [Gemmatales bacterium]|nr:hypothetical protein [Gemmatales bacterium]